MNPAKTDIRIVAGSLRGRRITCVVSEDLRPTPQRVREAMFSILGNAIPGREFFDAFAGTGVNGLEALSRGAERAVFVERDPALVKSIQGYLRKFELEPKSQVLRMDVYRWAERWQPPKKPVNLFLSPPFADFTEKIDGFMESMNRLWGALADDSVLTLQLEDGFPMERLPALGEWDIRKYGRNILGFRVKGDVALAEETPAGKDEVQEG